MRVNRASYSPGTGGIWDRLVVEIGDQSTRIQMDIVGVNAFMFRRVFTPGAEIGIDADDGSIAFHRLAPVEPKVVDMGGTAKLDNDEDPAVMSRLNDEAAFEDKATKVAAKIKPSLDKLAEDDGSTKLRANLRKA